MEADELWLLVGLKLMALSRLIMMDSCKWFLIFSSLLLAGGRFMEAFQCFLGNGMFLRCESGRGQ